MISIAMDIASDNSFQLWAHGTHPRDAFLSGCAAKLKQLDGRHVSLAGAPVLHVQSRSVPADTATNSKAVFDATEIASKPGRGVYAVTILDVWFPRQPDQVSGQSAASTAPAVEPHAFVSTPASNPPGLDRMKNWSAQDARAMLDDALIVADPAELTQRQAFNRLLPEMRKLRAKGIGFQQMAELLNKIGFSLKPETVRVYYSEHLALLKQQEIEA